MRLKFGLFVFVNYNNKLIKNIIFSILTIEVYVITNLILNILFKSILINSLSS